MGDIMPGRLERICHVCGAVGFNNSDDGYFYCGHCGSQADDVVATGVDEEELFENYSAIHRRTRPIAAEPISQVKLTQSQHLDHHEIPEENIDHHDGDGIGPTGPSDFGSSQKNLSYNEYYTEIRMRYLTGFQIMIQLQCQALVEKFNVSPLIVGIVGPIWLRYLAFTRIMADEWADKAIHESEAQTQGEDDEFELGSKPGAEPVNLLGQRAVMIWYKSLSSTIPLSYSLAISFLVCHVTREAILPTDILKWAIEGKLPYFAAFVEIKKQLGSHSKACPISVSRMFRPIHVVSPQKLESMAADIARKIQLELPPVNFYAIASRYCRQLSLPTSKILFVACHTCEWSMPPELYLSANEFRLPTRVCVMSILIVAIRILFDINGYGKWESSLSSSMFSLSRRRKNREIKHQCSSNLTDDTKDLSSNDLVPDDVKPDVQDARLDVVELLKILEAKYNELSDVYEYSGDLPSYLQYCKDVVFSGLQPLFEDHEEEKLIEELWDFYQNSKDAGTSNDVKVSGLPDKRSRNFNISRDEEIKRVLDDPIPREASQNCSTPHHRDNDSQDSMDQDKFSYSAQGPTHGVQPSMESYKDRAIRELKSDMEENRFCYIPPRVNIKNKDYVHYVRKKKGGVYIYAMHADYYILLRSCAKVARVDIRTMHNGVLSFERRLKWLEKRIDNCVHLKQNSTDYCDYCCDEVVKNTDDDSMPCSQLNT
ncbi:TATA box-binding protein-associated factor RNA polymerase I subunit B [Forsythia ovata]|uniref:TATA box-binding protein-associated factor RNA polymerase I subunit B n=1 Tax=Forsythia ovata TaxID=205694 RepID=A0ABD1R1T7_9LAMI